MQKLKISGNRLLAEGLNLDFPAVRIKIGDRIYKPCGDGIRENPRTRLYSEGDFIVRVEILPLAPHGWRKLVTLTADKPLPTPDWVEVDRQFVEDPTVTLYGYRAATADKGRPGSAEEGGGLMPLCGYPLIGKHFFAGIKHPAAFAAVERRDERGIAYTLTQHPVWDKHNRIVLADAVFGWYDNAETAFREYVDNIRLRPLGSPVFSLCSFWSDPYLGNYEYLSSPENYRSFVDAFASMEIFPDVYTLDAGWQNRKSIFEPKDAFGGENGLKKLDKHIREQGSRLGLWVSHNGPMGMDPEYLKSRGFAVGSGESSTYCGNGYAVLLDKKFEKALGDRLVELAEAGVMQYKMDWDNDCASNPDFAEKYPTRDHVREGSVNAMIRIAERIRDANGNIVIRSGWWPSPWWLAHIHHIFLPDSNDSEYAALPSRTQRDSAATYRDSMYYSCFTRDKSIFPLDAIDNHEFPHALRNPFHETPGTAMDNAMLAVMRGCSYFPLTIQPEALERWNADVLIDMMNFARNYGVFLYYARASMFGGNPNEGKIYGFRYEMKKYSQIPWSEALDASLWKTGAAFCVLRNPSAMPQCYEWKDEKRNGVWIYPYFAAYQPGTPIMFAPHEVKVIFLWRYRIPLPFDFPFQAYSLEDGRTEFFFPAHIPVTKQVSPAVKEIYRISGIESEWAECTETEDGMRLLFKLRLPYRMRNTTLNAAVETENLSSVSMEARLSRHKSSEAACCQLPVTRLSPGVPGHGLKKNTDLVPVYHEADFTVPCSEGGEAWYSLFIHGPCKRKDLKLSVSGFFAPSRNSIAEKWDYSWLGGDLPPCHPDGFPVAEMIELPPPAEA